MEPKAKKARFSNDSNNKIQKLEHVVVEDEFTQADLEELEFLATQMDKIEAVENSLFDNEAKKSNGDNKKTEQIEVMKQKTNEMTGKSLLLEEKLHRVEKQLANERLEKAKLNEEIHQIKTKFQNDQLKNKQSYEDQIEFVNQELENAKMKIKDLQMRDDHWAADSQFCSPDLNSRFKQIKTIKVTTPRSINNDLLNKNSQLQKLDEMGLKTKEQFSLSAFSQKKPSCYHGHLLSTFCDKLLSICRNENEKKLLVKAKSSCLYIFQDFQDTRCQANDSILRLSLPFYEFFKSVFRRSIKSRSNEDLDVESKNKILEYLFLLIKHVQSLSQYVIENEDGLNILIHLANQKEFEDNVMSIITRLLINTQPCNYKKFVKLSEVMEAPFTPIFLKISCLLVKDHQAASYLLLTESKIGEFILQLKQTYELSKGGSLHEEVLAMVINFLGSVTTLHHKIYSKNLQLLQVVQSVANSILDYELDKRCWRFRPHLVRLLHTCHPLFNDLLPVLHKEFIESLVLIKFQYFVESDPTPRSSLLVKIMKTIEDELECLSGFLDESDPEQHHET